MTGRREVEQIHRRNNLALGAESPLVQLKCAQCQHCQIHRLMIKKPPMVSLEGLDSICLPVEGGQSSPYTHHSDILHRPYVLEQVPYVTLCNLWMEVGHQDRDTLEWFRGCPPCRSCSSPVQPVLDAAHHSWNGPHWWHPVQSAG